MFRTVARCGRYGAGMPAPIVFLDEEVIAPYAPALRPGASLSHALAAVRSLHDWGGERDLVALAARLLVRVNAAHALIDGNKRAAVALCDTFLAANGAHLEGAPGDLALLCWDVAAGRVRDPEAPARLAPFVASGAPPAPFAARYPQVMEDLAFGSPPEPE